MEDVGKELKRIISQRNYQQKFAEMIEEVLNDPDVQAFLADHKDELTQADIEKVMQNYMNLSKKTKIPKK